MQRSIPLPSEPCEHDMTCNRPLQRTLGQSETLQGITFQEGTDIYMGLEGELVMCQLPSDATISGVPCRAGLVHFAPAGGLAQATLATDFVYNGVSIQAGSLVSWNDEGEVTVHMADAHTIGGVTLPATAVATLDNKGNLKRWSTRVSEALQLGEIACQPGSVVTRYGDGRIDRITVGADVRVSDAFVAMTGTDLHFHPSGQVATVTLAVGLERAGIAFDVGTTLNFRDDGTLSLAQLANDVEIGGKHYEDGTYLQFNASERLTGHVAIGWSVAARTERD